MSDWPEEGLTVGTLGGPFTFAGQATASLLEARTDYVGPQFFPTMDAVVEAVEDGAVDLGVLTSETSGTAATETVGRLLGGDRLFIVDEIVVPYRCALLVRPGTALDEIRHVGGHGSIRQCGPFLREALPQASVEIHRLNSMQAAREILDGDGTTAVIGTEAVAREFGLEILVRDVDRGSTAGWWALASERRSRPEADHLAVIVEGIDRLSRLLGHLAAVGVAVRSITNGPTGRVFQQRFLVTARTPDASPVPLDALIPFQDEVIGLFTSSTVVSPS